MSIRDRVKYNLMWFEMWVTCSVGFDHLGFQFFWFRLSDAKKVTYTQLRDECATNLVWRFGDLFITIPGPDAN